MNGVVGTGGGLRRLDPVLLGFIQPYFLPKIQILTMPICGRRATMVSVVDLVHT